MDKETVLVVDDEPDIRSVCRGALEDEGFTVLEADCGVAALAHLGLGRATDDPVFPPVDVVLLDLLMPDLTLDGFEVLRRIRGRPHPPVVVMTAVGGERNLEYAMRLGAVDILSKPFELDDLLGVVKEAVHAP